MKRSFLHDWPGQVVCVGFGAWFIYLIVVLGLASKSADGPLAAAGQIGDSFGLLNSLFTMVAMIATLATVLHQRDELRRAIEEGRSDRREARFNILLTMLRETARDVATSTSPYETTPRVIYGHSAFQFLLNLACKRGATNILASRVGSLGTWIQTIVAMIDFVNARGDDERAFLVTLFRTQVSETQEKLLTILATSDQTRDMFSDLSEKLESVGMRSLTPYANSESED